ncbi:ABC transporter permease [Devriesea agamarum]|uniref:ABC transporter permease n=1 Tax=Devriesea agamarum TaxID=472569 RepID=UPI00071E328A|nr:FtsX-like permease family protein [Devriesea agamarum]
MTDGTRVLLRSDLRAMITTHRPLFTLLLAAIALLLATQTVVGAGLAHYAHQARTTSALNLIEVSAAAPSAQRDLSAPNRALIAKTPGVTHVYPWYQVSLSLHESSDWPDPMTNPGEISGSPIIPGLMPPLVAGDLPPQGLADDQILLPKNVPGGNTLKLLHKKVSIEFTADSGIVGVGQPGTREFTVVGIVDNSVPGKSGPQPAFLSDGALSSLLHASAGKPSLDSVLTTMYVQTADADQVASVQKALSEKGFAVSSLRDQMPDLGGLFTVLGLASWVLTAAAAVLCMAIGASAGTTWVRQRRREIGILKALGYSNGRIGRIIAAELFLAGVLTAVIGILVGIVLSLIATTAVSYADISLLPVAPWGLPSWQSVIIVLVATPFFLTLGGLRHVIASARLEPDEALRDM